MVTGSSVASTHKALGLVREHPGQLFATAGVHPHHAVELTESAASELAELARRPEVVAVGECGLDYYRDLAPREAQRRAFHRQLELAAQVDKPVFLHQRDAHADFAAILREHGARHRGVAHCFTGGGEELRCYLELGLAIGITGWICDERRGAHLLALVREIPARAAAARNRRPLPGAARSQSAAGLAPQRARLPAAHRRHRRARPRAVAGSARAGKHGGQPGTFRAVRNGLISRI